MPGWAGWQVQLLQHLGDDVTEDSYIVLTAWTRSVNNRGKNNPMGATHAAAGATNYNKAGIKNYPSHAAALQATVEELLLPKYSALPVFIADPHGSHPTTGPHVNPELKTWGVNLATFQAQLDALTTNPPQIVYPPAPVTVPAGVSKAWRNIMHYYGHSVPTKRDEARKLAASYARIFR